MFIKTKLSCKQCFAVSKNYLTLDINISWSSLQSNLHFFSILWNHSIFVGRLSFGDVHWSADPSIHMSINSECTWYLQYKDWKQKGFKSIRIKKPIASFSHPPPPAVAYHKIHTIKCQRDIFFWQWNPRNVMPTKLNDSAVSESVMNIIESTNNAAFYWIQ